MSAAKAAAELRKRAGSWAAAEEAAEKADLATGVATSAALPVTFDTSFTVVSTSTPGAIRRG